MHLQATRMSFGGVAIDGYRPTEEFPSKSMIVGMIANALGLRAGEHDDQHIMLQDTLSLATAAVRRPRIETEFQVSELDPIRTKYWSTSGVPIEKTSTFNTELSQKQYLVDGYYVCALGIKERMREFPITRIAQALAYPKRTIFIGRKNCHPTRPLVDSDPYVFANTCHHALSKHLGRGFSAEWDFGEGPEDGPNVHLSKSTRGFKEWRTGRHHGHTQITVGET